MMLSIATLPSAVAEILAMAARISNDELSASDLVDGVDGHKAWDSDLPDLGGDGDGNIAPDEDLDVGEYGGVSAGTQQAFKSSVLERFTLLAEAFERLRSAHAEDGYGSPGYVQAQHAISKVLVDVQFSSRIVHSLCDRLRAQADEICRIENEVRRIAVDRCGLALHAFNDSFPGHQTQLDWACGLMRSYPDVAAAIDRHLPAIRALQSRLIEIQQIAVVPLDEFKQISAAMHQNEVRVREAKHIVIEANLRLVVAIARFYFHPEIGIDDLIQEGRIGLIRAVDRFQYRHGHKFSTFAVWWIRQAIARSISNQASAIRVPVYMLDAARKMHRISQMILQESGEKASIPEIASRMSISSTKARKIYDTPRVDTSLNAPQTLDFPCMMEVAMDEERTPLTAPLVDMIAGDDSMEPQNLYVATEIRRLVAEALLELPKRQRYIIRERFGLLNGIDRTLDAIARDLDLTRERVRQIEVKALRRLRSMDWLARVWIEDFAQSTPKPVAERLARPVTPPAPPNREDFPPRDALWP